MDFSLIIDRFLEFETQSLLKAYSLLRISNLKSEKTLKNFKYIFLGFCIISNKLIDDYTIWNSRYKDKWGVTVKQLNEIEILVLRSINFNLENKIERFEL